MHIKVFFLCKKNNRCYNYNVKKQRFLNREAEKGNSEYEALKALVEILGIEFPKLKKRRNKFNYLLRYKIVDNNRTIPRFYHKIGSGDWF